MPPPDSWRKDLLADLVEPPKQIRRGHDKLMHVTCNVTRPGRKKTQTRNKRVVAHPCKDLQVVLQWQSKIARALQDH